MKYQETVCQLFSRSVNVVNIIYRYNLEQFIPKQWGCFLWWVWTGEKQLDHISSRVVVCGSASRWTRLVKSTGVLLVPWIRFVLCTPENQGHSMVIFVITNWEKKSKWGRVNWCLNGIRWSIWYLFSQGRLVIAVFFSCNNVSFSYIFKLP